MSSTSNAIANMRRQGRRRLGRPYPRGSKISPKKPQKGLGSALVMK